MANYSDKMLSLHLTPENSQKIYHMILILFTNSTYMQRGDTFDVISESHWGKLEPLSLPIAWKIPKRSNGEYFNIYPGRHLCRVRNVRNMEFWGNVIKMGY